MELAILVLGVLASLGLGLFIVAYNPRSATNRLFLFLAIASSAWSIATYASLRTPTPESTLLAVRWVFFFATLYSLSIYSTVATYPNAKIKASVVKIASLGACVLLVLGLTWTPLVISHMSGAGASAQLNPGPLIPLFALLNAYLIGAAMVGPIIRIRKSKGSLRAQLQYLLLGVILSNFLAFTTSFLLPNVFHTNALLPLGPLYPLVFIGAIAYTIVAHRLFDIRVIIKRTIVYSGLLLVTLAGYSMIVFLLTAVFGGRNIFNGKIFFTNLVAAILISLGFDPLRRVLQERTDRFFFKKEYEQQEVLKDLSERLNSVIALDEALEIVMQSMVRALHLKHAATYVFQAGENGTLAIKRIKQIGYKNTSNLFVQDKDFLVQYFSRTFGTVVVERFEQDLEHEQARIQDGSFKDMHQDAEKVSAFIREHAVKQSVLKKLKSLDAALAVPLHLDQQPIGLIILSEKMSQEVFLQPDLALIELVGAHAISSIQKAKLYEGDQMKSEFVSIASHELLTPISAIEGYLSMILDENIGTIDNQARDYLSKVYTSAKRLSLLIKDLLSVSRIEAGRLKFENQSLDLAKMINDTLDQLKFVAQQKNIVMNFKPQSLPLPPVWADPDRVMQVLVNLVSNAIKYTPRGTVTITATVERENKLVRVEVADNGIGMSKEAQSHLFEKFYRIESPDTVGVMGTGLGLYITKSILERMGGSIQVKSTVGKGSVFTFTLPLFEVELSTLS